MADTRDNYEKTQVENVEAILGTAISTTVGPDNPTSTTAQDDDQVETVSVSTILAIFVCSASFTLFISPSVPFNLTIARR